VNTPELEKRCVICRHRHKDEDEWPCSGCIRLARDFLQDFFKLDTGTN